jgi:hypothetical protein
MNLFRSLFAQLAPAAQHSTPIRRDFAAHPDTPLVVLNEHGDALRVRDFYEGIQIVGGTGAGKSSSSGQAIALSMLEAGWGGIVFCAKPDEAQRWVGYLEASGRLDDLILMRPGSGLNFNFIDYEIHRPDGLGLEVFNLVAAIMVVVEGMRTALGIVQDSDGAFWVTASREMLTNAIEPLVAATGRFRLDELMRMIASAPTTEEQAYSEDWKARSYCYWVLAKAYSDPAGPPLPRHAMQAATDYWFSTFAKLDGKTRSNIVATVTAAISPFLRGTLHETFCTDTTVIPELTHEGAVIVVDFPVKTLGPAAVVTALIMKYQWQRATERRAIGPGTRPCFSYSDECQHFFAKTDPEFQSTARSSMAATVCLTQNLPTYFALLPGRDPKSAAESLLGNFQTKIFHANTDAVTNQYASDLIGKNLQRRASSNWSVNEGWQQGENASGGWSYQTGESTGRNWGMTSSFGTSQGSQGISSTSSTGMSKGSQEGTSRSRTWSRNHGTSEGVSGGSSSGGGWSEQMDYTVPPAAFASKLRKGGQSDGWQVDAVIVQGGRRFARTDAHWLPCTFQQHRFS